jgi:AcrR family transcriptional regulator
MGTVFLYADNKRDLLFLIANDELEAITAKAIASFRAEAAVLANLIRAFRPHYEFFGEQPKLSRYKLREMMFYDSGKQAKRFQATRERLIALLTSIIAAGQERETIKRSEDAALIGWVAFCIYQVEMRSWLTSDAPDLRSGLRRLEKALKLLLEGAEVR